MRVRVFYSHNILLYEDGHAVVADFGGMKLNYKHDYKWNTIQRKETTQRGNAIAHLWWMLENIFLCHWNKKRTNENQTNLKEKWLITIVNGILNTFWVLIKVTIWENMEIDSTSFKRFKKNCNSCWVLKQPFAQRTARVMKCRLFWETISSFTCSAVATN